MDEKWKALESKTPIMGNVNLEGIAARIVKDPLRNREQTYNNSSKLSDFSGRVIFWLNYLRDGFKRFAQPAWNALTQVFGGVDSLAWSQMQHLCPLTAEGLLDSTRYSPDIPSSKSVSRFALKLVSTLCDVLKVLVFHSHLLSVLPTVSKRSLAPRWENSSPFH